MRRDMTAEAQDASNTKPQGAGPGAGAGACAEDPKLWLLGHEFWLESRGKAARLGAGAASQWGTEGAQIREVTMETHPRPKPEALEPSGCGQGKGEGGRGGPWPAGRPLASGEPSRRRGRGKHRAWGPWQKHQVTDVSESASQGSGIREAACMGQGPAGVFPWSLWERGYPSLYDCPPSPTKRSARTWSLLAAWRRAGLGDLKPLIRAPVWAVGRPVEAGVSPFWSLSQRVLASGSWPLGLPRGVGPAHGAAPGAEQQRSSSVGRSHF